jgi:hypothetical protein
MHMTTIASATTTEDARIAAHIEGAERAAVRAAPRGLSRLQRLTRALLLEALADYRRAGVFPRNTDFPDRPTPYFIDARGVRCAMAHLMELGGAAALVARIARTRNNAFVRELADEPELLAWLDAAGLSVAEAARIQPTYCDVPAANVCGGMFQSSVRAGAVGVLELVVASHGEGGRAFARVETVYGDGRGLSVGDEVHVVAHAVGTRILSPVYESDPHAQGAVDAGTAAVEVGTFGGDAGKTAPSPAVRSGLILTGDQVAFAHLEGRSLQKDVVVDALRTAERRECVHKLGAIDSYWTTKDCDDGAMSCSAAATLGGDAGATLAVLVALVAALAGRNAARARGA